MLSNARERAAYEHNTVNSEITAEGKKPDPKEYTLHDPLCVKL